PRHEQREGILTQRHRDAEVTQRRIFLPDCLINILFTHLNAAIMRSYLSASDYDAASLTFNLCFSESMRIHPMQAQRLRDIFFQRNPDE
ncbi:MAG: hypothetical protein AB1631_34310, partial [Acidobacteriota bacterium]